MSYRKEKKYKLSKCDLNLLKSLLIKKGMKILYPKRTIYTCYFDTQNYKMFFESEAGILPRKKIRFRWYHNDLNINKEKKITSSEGRFKQTQATNYKYLITSDINSLKALNIKPLFKTIKKFDNHFLLINSGK